MRSFEMIRISDPDVDHPKGTHPMILNKHPHDVTPQGYGGTQDSKQCLF